MNWNNGYERKKFEEEQTRLAEEYRKQGMNEAQIREMYLFDLAWYKSKRRFYTHTLSVTSNAVAHCDDEDDFENALYKMFSKAISTTIDKFVNHPRSHWVEDIDDPLLVQKLKQLNTDDLNLLTLFAFDGYTLTEIGNIYQCTPQNIYKKYKRIKKILL